MISGHALKTLKLFCLLAVLGGAGFAAAGAAETRSLDPPVYLPNGEQFKTWEVPLEFSRTYYVDGTDPQAADDNPGTELKPFRTINRAAQVLRPGERVVIAAGTYRERVRPRRGGTGPNRVISYEAAPGADVVLSGSCVLKTRWRPSVRNGKPGPKSVWMTELPQEMFADENPFRAVNLTVEQIDRCMPWAVGIKKNPVFALRRGLIFLNGERLKQVNTYEQLAGRPGSYWVEEGGKTVHCLPSGDVDPNNATVEVTVQGFVFAPDEYGLGYIRVKGLTIQHAGNCFPRPQHGALSTQRGHHWIIEDNAVRQVNAIGIDIGDQFDVEGPELAGGGRHIVRRNLITDCGIGGLEGKRIERTLIEANVIRRCGWHDILRIYETGGIKVHCTLSTLVRCNLITDTTGAPGIWMDYANENSRCTRNVVVDIDSSNGAIFMEASQRPNLVDHNFVFNSTGNGIYQHDCDELTIAHNLIVGAREAGICMRICRGRKVMGRLSTAKRNTIVGNILVDNGSMLAISDPDNRSDHNVFAGSRKPFDLKSWQSKHGRDQHSVTADARAVLDRETLQLVWYVGAPVPTFSRIKPITHDFLNEPLADETVAGPFRTVFADKGTIRLDVLWSRPRKE